MKCEQPPPRLESTAEFAQRVYVDRKPRGHLEEQLLALFDRGTPCERDRVVDLMRGGGAE